MTRVLIRLRKTAVVTGVFALGYGLGHHHALSTPDEVRFRRMRKETMARVQERKRERLQNKARKAYEKTHPSKDPK